MEKLYIESEEFKIDGLTESFNKTKDNNSATIFMEYTFKGEVYDVLVDINLNASWINRTPPEELKKGLDEYLKQFKISSN